MTVHGAICILCTKGLLVRPVHFEMERYMRFLKILVFAAAIVPIVRGSDGITQTGPTITDRSSGLDRGYFDMYNVDFAAA